MNKKITFALLLVICLSLAGTSFPVNAADAGAITGVLKVDSTAVNIFEPIKDDGDNGDHVHGSSITELPSGELISVWFQGNGERDATTTRIMGARSVDGGKTWKTPFLMADSKDIADINPAVYVDAGERLWLFWYPVLAGRWETSQPKYAYAEKGSYEFANVGNKKPNWTWSEVINVKIGLITGDPVNPDNAIDFISPRLQKGYVNTLKQKLAEFKAYNFKPVDQGGAGVNARINGEDFDGYVDQIMKLAGGNSTVDSYAPSVADKIWKGRSGYPLARRLGWQTKNKPFTIPTNGGKVRMLLPLYSDTLEQSIYAITEYDPSKPLQDNEIHWEFSEPIVGDAIIQASMAQRKDGTLVAYLRDNGAAPYRVVSSESKDGGFTWTIGKDVPELIDPGVGHDMVQLKNGNWAFVHVDAQKKRNSLAVALSDDEGRTWKYRRHLAIDSRANPGDYHYPAITEAKNGDILITFTRDFAANDGALNGFNNIMYSRVTEDWIKQGDADGKLVVDFEKVELDIAVPSSFSIGTANDKTLRAMLPLTVKGYMSYGKGPVNEKMNYVDLPVNWDLNALRSNFKWNSFIKEKITGVIDLTKLPAGITKEQIPAFQPLLRGVYYYQDPAAQLIVDLKDSNVITNAGVAPVLPSVVTAVYSDNKEASVGVKWQPIDPAKYAAAGTFDVSGDVTGTNLKAAVHITVVEVEKPRVLVRLKDESITTSVGKAPVLPSVVTAVYSDNKEEPVKVTWEQIDPLKYSAPGDFDVRGSVKETNINAVAHVSVKPILVEKVVLDQSSISLWRGETAQLKATVTPDNATNKMVSWSSSNPAVASVDANGLITTLANGETVITVKTVDGSFEAKASVQVRTRSNSKGSSSGGGGGSSTPPTTTPATPDTTAPKPDETKKPETKPDSGQNEGSKQIFNDIAGHSWAQEAIKALKEKGIVNGTSEQTFEPDKNISRADFLTMLVRALGVKAEFTSNFEDVTKSDYFYEALGISKSLGITDGVDGVKFNPLAEISRQDLMVLAARALKLSGKITASGTAADLNGFTDAKDIAAYAQESVATLVKAGIIEGNDNKVNPQGKATRAEVATIVYRILNKIK
ncbi:S-layer homology domain-containing protein [Paenibacillus radicis (ex Xue et al. 2023)]|uniref:S-layer homology domain-containing protein n=1 Tax=Paenibacillus radicis (ex Xue et al. 2023) TaxID=2972489 RepID=A0ABT1Y8Y7_9BACL|nr:S-layer homology domain-containing protein [Paenibacillus radicis (ex Xue et al. 2023)]MCR8629651.1 S-layer homology domain-containing protein [Paenibacillus radicis (ex Xue et al. 2023)]